MPTPAVAPATSKWVKVTPKMAETWLAKNADNRKIRRLVVSQYARDMKNDHWQTTHQGVAFDRNGVLRDGQHRLMAIIESGTPIWMLVTEGLDPDAQRHMDRGSTRRVSDFMEGVNAPARVASARYLIALRKLEGRATHGELGRAAREVTDGDLYALFSEETGLAEDLELLSTPARRASTFLTDMGPTPLMVAAVTYPEIGEEAIAQLTTGAGMTEHSPLLALRNYRGTGLSHTHIAVHTALRVFGAATQGKSMAKLIVMGIERPVVIQPR